MSRFDHALKVLEFDLIRQRLAARCEVVLASEKAAELEPVFETAGVWELLDRTQEAHDLLAESAPPSLGAIRDCRKAVHRASKGATLGGAELAEIGASLTAMRAFKAVLKPKTELSFLHLQAERLPEIGRLEERLSTCLESDGEVRDAASAKLATLRQRRRSLANRIVERIQAFTTGKSRDLLSDPIYTVRDGRYVLPVKAENRGKIKGIVHDSSASGQTIYVEPEEVLQIGNQIREAEGEERAEVQRILGELSQAVGAHADAIKDGIEASAEIDFTLACARLAYDMHASPPDRAKGVGIEISAGRHPLLDRDTAIPLNLSLGFEHAGVLITGPNTGGKTVAIKTVGLFVLMAQSGLFLPATHVKLGPFSQVWADIGDEQSLQQSLSTFSAHVKNIAEALRGLEAGALVLFDEIGAGTDPAEGAALAKAILTALVEKGAKALASTHYGELKAFAYQTPGFVNAAMEFDAKTLRPTYRLLMGAPGGSHALQIASRYGIPKPVVDQAQANLSPEAQQMGEMLGRLDEAQRLARKAQSEADKQSAAVRKMEEEVARKLAEADSIRRTVHGKAQEQIEEAMREVRLAAAKVFDDLRASVPQREIEEARRKIKTLLGKGEEAAEKFSVPKPKTSEQEIVKGASVRVEGYPQTGTAIEEPRGGFVTVLVGSLKIKAALHQVTLAQPEPKPVSRRGTSTLKNAASARTEIHLRAMRAENAQDELERFIDEALLGGIDQVRIVHGKGEGILRKLTQDYLRKHPHVASIRDGEPGEGGSGVTVARLK